MGCFLCVDLRWFGVSCVSVCGAFIFRFWLVIWFGYAGVSGGGWICLLSGGFWRFGFAGVVSCLGLCWLWLWFCSFPGV